MCPLSSLALSLDHDHRLTACDRKARPSEAIADRQLHQVAQSQYSWRARRTATGHGRPRVSPDRKCMSLQSYTLKTYLRADHTRIIPSSAHAAFWKASQYFGIKLHVVKVDETSRKADVKRMKRAM